MGTTWANPRTGSGHHLDHLVRLRAALVVAGEEVAEAEGLRDS